MFENNVLARARPFRSKTAENACFPGFPGRAAARIGASGREKAPRLRREARDFSMQLVNYMLIVVLSHDFIASQPEPSQSRFPVTLRARPRAYEVIFSHVSHRTMVCPCAFRPWLKLRCAPSPGQMKNRPHEYAGPAFLLLPGVMLRPETGWCAGYWKKRAAKAGLAPRSARSPSGSRGRPRPGRSPSRG